MTDIMLIHLVRYSDFLVHEISRDKKVVQLTDLSTLPVQLVKVVTLMLIIMYLIVIMLI